MEKQRPRCTGQKGKGENERKAGNRLQSLDPENMIEGGNDERTGDYSGDIGVEDNHQAPVHMDIVGKNVVGQCRHGISLVNGSTH